MWRLVPALVQQMGAAYPELLRAQPLITETLRFEETNFKQTLDRGLRLLEDETARLGPGAALPGEVAFRLYDTFGFPLDLTEDVLRAQDRRVAVEGFSAAMERQRQEARQSWVGSGEAATEAVWFALRDEVGATEFLGYETETAEGVVLAIMRNGERVDEAANGDEVGVVVNQTPFYAESGGQIGDTGVIFSPNGAELTVRDTVKKAGDLHVHLGTLTHGTLKVGDAVELRVDGARRRLLRANHSVTHLLHQALRRRLGEHVTQKGSLVAPDRLRFDFSHPRPLTQEDIGAIEAEVNERIRDNGAVRTRLLTPDRAVAEGALALFGEKYGDEVRVVAMGAANDERAALFGRAVRRHACRPHRRYRPVQDRRRKRDRFGRAPHRSADRRRRRGISRRGRGDVAPGRRGVAHDPVGIAGARRQPGRGAPPARARAWPKPAGRWRMPVPRPNRPRNGSATSPSTAASSTRFPGAS